MRWVGAGLAAVFVVIQFFGPAKSNPATDQSRVVNAHLQVPPPVASIFNRSCNDCHSNNTRWPWYSNVAPVSWFVIGHVNEGRRHMNFSDWTRLNQREEGQMLKSICQEVTSGGMPLSSYTPMHPGSTLSAGDVKTLCDWAGAETGRLAQR